MDNRIYDYRKKRGSNIKGLKLITGLWVVTALILSACQAAPSTPVVVPTDTPIPAPTNTPVPTSTPAPTDTPVPAPTNTPVSTPTEEVIKPSVSVADQSLMEGKVIIARAVSNGPGWLVIHSDKDGAPGPVLGYTAVSDGENMDVVVVLAAEGRTETLHAMLHTDAGTEGNYEFPGDDIPVSVDGSVVNIPFQITGGLTEDAMVEQEVAVTLVNFAFAPGDLTIKAGTTVIWTSEDSAPHTVTADDGLFDSGTIRRGGSFSYTFTQSGEYPYYCAFHGAPGGGGMAGTIIVTE